MLALLELSPGTIVERVRKGEVIICVVGLGSMGLPTACLLVKAGARVIGVDSDPYVLEIIKRGRGHASEPNLSALVGECIRSGSFEVTDDAEEAARRSDVIMVIVPTLVDREGEPDYSHLERACKSIGRGLRKGALVIIQSTVGPGVTEKVVKEVLERHSGLRAGMDFGLAYSPIRAAVGKALHDIPAYPRVVGAVDKRSLEVAAAVLSVIVEGGVIKVRSVKTAETIKLFENVYRDVNIALANQLARFCEAAGVDYDECMEVAGTQPFCHLHVPTSGVGGPCIPVNPYFLIKEAENLGVKLSLLRLARKINDDTPRHVVRLVKSALAECGKSLRRAKIAALGVSFKADVKDARFSPAKRVIGMLTKLGAEVAVHDPHFTVEELRGLGYTGAGSIAKVVSDADCLLILVGHREFSKISLSTLDRLMRKPAAVVDCGHVINPEKLKAAFVYRGVGRV